MRAALGAARRRRRRRGWSDAARPVGLPRRRGRGAAARAARPGLARRGDRPGRRARRALRHDLATTAATPAAAASARSWARRTSRPSRCAPRTQGRAGRPGGACWPRPASCAHARSARPPPSTASWARSPTCWRSTRSATLPTRNFQAAHASTARRSWPPRSCAEPRSVRAQLVRVLHDRLRAHLRRGRRRGARWSTRTSSRSGRCAASPTPTPCSPPARRCDELGLDTISAGGTIALAMECAERGLHRRAVAALRRRRRAAARARRDRRARGPGRPARRGLAARGREVGGGAERFAPHVKGLEMPGLRAAHPADDGAGPGRRRARGADHNRSGAYEADLSGGARPPARRRGARRGRRRDRGPRRDHGLADPVQVPARRLRRPVRRVGRAAGAGDRLGRRRPPSSRPPRGASSWPSACSICARAGRPPRTGCPSASWTRSSRSSPAARPALTAERLRGMVDAYYRERGLDEEGRPAEGSLADLRLPALLEY